jgi:lipoprotein-releasing system permease protein
MHPTTSKLPYELLIGWRYTRAGRVAGRNGFISFISGVSMMGIALGVAALIIVLSVMNGFQKEVRDRMLAVVAHIELLAPGGEGFADTQALMAQAKQNAEVVAAAPFVSQQALMARGEDMRGAMVRGIDPEAETQVSDFTLQIPAEVRATLQAGSFNVVLGGELAMAMGVRVGDHQSGTGHLLGLRRGRWLMHSCTHPRARARMPALTARSEPLRVPAVG